MLVNYRKDYRKIALGLLSFCPDLKKYHRLATVLDDAGDSQHPIWLWQDGDSHQMIGIVILELSEAVVLVRRLSFSPSERSGRNVYAMLAAVHKYYPGRRLMGTLWTQPLVSNWERDHYYRHRGKEDQNE